MTAYDGFAHLCRSIFCGKSDLMSMLAIYCDDSGTDPKNRVAVVAGYIGQVVQWERFTPEWKSILKKYKVPQMHRSDLECWGGDFTEARGWNPDRRTAFLKELQPIIRKRTKVQIGSAVIKEDFEAVMTPYIKRMFGGVYGWCVQECIVAVSKWCDHHSHEKPIQWVFEAGTIGQGQVMEMFRSLYAHPDYRKKCRIKGWAFEDKSVVPLQAADVLAYESFKQVENQIIDGGKRPIRLSMRHLMGSDSGTYLKYWNKERLKDWLDKWYERYEPSFSKEDEAHE